MSTWVDHDGTSFPLDADSLIKVRRRGGDRDSHERWAGRWRFEYPNPWLWDADSENPGDIVAYIVIEPAGWDK